MNWLGLTHPQRRAVPWTAAAVVTLTALGLAPGAAAAPRPTPGMGAAVPCSPTVNYTINGGVNRQYGNGCANGVAWWLGNNAHHGTRVALSSVSDGTSNTAAFCERFVIGSRPDS